MQEANKLNKTRAIIKPIEYDNILSTLNKWAHNLSLSNVYNNIQLECAASNGNRYPPYPQVMATAISQ